MKTTISKCTCDYCSQEMGVFEYDHSPKITIRLDLPDPRGGCGQVAAIEVRLCSTCCESIGVVNLPEYHQYIDSQNRLTNVITRNKEKFLKLCFGRK